MRKCTNCGTSSAWCWTSFDKKEVCMDCYETLKRQKIVDAGKDIKEASDFEDWKMSDMSELFWISLGEYKKRPNRRSLQLMHRALLWACHADHGLSNSFRNALDWCEIDIYEEKNRKDLPEE